MEIGDLIDEELEKQKQIVYAGHVVTTGKHDAEAPAVNHPVHYNAHPSGIECIEVVRHMNFNLGNVMKYIWRAGIKGGDVSLQDLKKAAWYLDDEIKRMGAEET